MTFYYQNNQQQFSKEAVERCLTLFKKFREGDFKQDDMIHLAGDGGSLPAELNEEV